MIRFSDLTQDCGITITGYSSTVHRNLYDLDCVVATVDDEAIKVWPEDDDEPQLTAAENRAGKLWFFWKDVTEITIRSFP